MKSLFFFFFGIFSVFAAAAEQCDNVCRGDTDTSLACTNCWCATGIYAGDLTCDCLNSCDLTRGTASASCKGCIQRWCQKSGGNSRYECFCQNECRVWSWADDNSATCERCFDRFCANYPQSAECQCQHVCTGVEDYYTLPCAECWCKLRPDDPDCEEYFEYFNRKK